MAATYTLLATHPATDLDGYAALIGLRYMYPGARLLLHETLEEIVREVVRRDPPPDTVRLSELEPRQVARLVIADAADPARVGAWTRELAPETPVILFDHHPPADLSAFPRAERVWGEVGSACTLVTERLAAAGVVPSPDDATLLLAGLYEDTGQLAFLSAVERDFAAALQLVRWKAEPAAAGDLVQRMWTLRQADIFRELAQSCRPAVWGNLRAVIARAELPFFVPDLAGLATRLSPPGADALFVLAALRGKVFVVARALRSGVDVAAVAARLGGGGHAAAASALLHDMGLVEAEQALLRELDREEPRVRTAAAIMSAPPIRVDAAAALATAHETLVRFRVGSLLVEEAGKVVGVLDYATAGGAVSHGHGAEPVGPYARRPAVFVSPQASVADLRASLLESGERIYAVGAPDATVGVVTRRDILRALYEESLPLETAEVAQSDKVRGLAKEVESQLGATAAGHLRRFGELAEGLGLEIFLVGGCVRDLILRKNPVDWDLVVVGDGEPFLAHLRAEGAKVKLHGRFHTAHVHFADGSGFDLARARKESYARPGALPAVEPAGLEQDLFRRDFTINAMALDLAPKRFGRLVDRFRGLDDLKHKRIRVLHSLSFIDDPTRAFRALRLATRFGFALTEDTERLLARAADLRVFVDSEGTRLRRELALAFREPEPVAVLRAYEARGLFRACLADYQFEPYEGAVQAALEWSAWFRLQFGVELPRADTLHLTALALGAPGARRAAILAAFKLPQREIEWIEAAWDAADALERDFSRGLGRGEAAERLAKTQPEGLVLWALRQPARRETVIAYLTEWVHVRPAITGDDVVGLGVKPGPDVGRWLEWVRQGVLDGRLPADRAAQLAALKQALTP